VSAYRYRPLADAPHTGILESKDGLQVAEFLTVPKVAQRMVSRIRNEERDLLKKLREEAAQPEWYPER
jgi:hypothetical protein